MSEIDDIIRHTIETVQYALREGFKQGWDAAEDYNEIRSNRILGLTASRDQLAMEYADSFSEGIGAALHGKAEDPRRGGSYTVDPDTMKTRYMRDWEIGDKVRHQDGQPEGEVIGLATMNGEAYTVVRWESGVEENCTPEELTPA